MRKNLQVFVFVLVFAVVALGVATSDRTPRPMTTDVAWIYKAGYLEWLDPQDLARSQSLNVNVEGSSWGEGSWVEHDGDVSRLYLGEDFRLPPLYGTYKPGTGDRPAVKLIRACCMSESSSGPYFRVV